MQLFEYTVNYQECNVQQISDLIYNSLGKRLCRRYLFETVDGYIELIWSNTSNNLKLYFNESLSSGEITTLNNIITNYTYDPDYDVVNTSDELITGELSSNINNFYIDGLHEVTTLKIRSTKKIYITGIKKPPHNQIIRFLNVGIYQIVFESNDSASLQNNRINSSGDIILNPNQSVTFIYDKQSSRWTV